MAAGAAAGGAAAAAAAIAQAIRASGVLVRVEPREFEAIVGRTKAPLVVTATGGLFTTNYQYLTSYKGLAFFTYSEAPVPLPGDLLAVDGEPDRAGRAVAHGPDDLVHPAAARRHERLGAGAEHSRQPVAAQSGVLADPAIVEDRDLLACIGVEPIGDPLRVFRA